MVLSQLPETTRLQSGNNATLSTEPVCPRRMRRNCPVPRSHSERVPSVHPETTCSLSGETCGSPTPHPQRHGYVGEPRNSSGWHSFDSIVRHPCSLCSSACSQLLRLLSPVANAPIPGEGRAGTATSPTAHHGQRHSVPRGRRSPSSLRTPSSLLSHEMHVVPVHRSHQPARPDGS